VGAETTIYVLVVKEVTEWREVHAVTLSEATEKAEKLDGVVRVLEAAYDPAYIT
jgi:tetrahydromethanopterin S-methyltransferase subunit B